MRMHEWQLLPDLSILWQTKKHKSSTPKWIKHEINTKVALKLRLNRNLLAKGTFESDRRSVYAIIQCKILHHSGICGRMITTFFYSSMPVKKCRCQIAPPFFPFHPLLHSWSLHFDLFICWLRWRARQDNGAFYSGSSVPTTSILQSPRVTHSPRRSDVTWSWGTGPLRDGRTKRGKYMAI